MAENFVLKFPRGYSVTVNPNEKHSVEFDKAFCEQIKQAFHDFTEGTAKAYMYQDKLVFIDLIRTLNNPYDLTERITSYMAYEFEENGNFISEDDVYCYDFLDWCIDEVKNLGLYGHYGDDNHIYDEVMRLIALAIKVVINYEDEE